MSTVTPMKQCSFECENEAVADFYSDFVRGRVVYAFGGCPICEFHAEILGGWRFLTELHYYDGRIVKIRDAGESKMASQAHAP